MKKLLFTLTLFTGLSASAQLPDGSIAPDFTLTDINGVSHNLYTYLDQGKTVFIDVSATWCGPCWSFHNTHALDDLWTNHGPMGAAGVSGTTTDDVVVIFVEGDASTNSADLHGTGGNTQGDWVSGVDHPIIDPVGSAVSTFNDDFAIGYFPTIYKICQNRRIYEVGQQSASALYNSVGTCPAPASDPTDVAFISYDGSSNICGPDDYTPIVTIQNYGVDPLTSATINILQNGNIVSTGTYTGSLSTYGTAQVTCSVIPNFNGGNLTVNMTAAGENNTSNNISAATVTPAIDVDSRIMLSILTDAYASEISWRIRNANGQVVPGTTDPALSNNTQYDFTYNLSSMGCYTFSITDSYGDGITPGTISVTDSDGTVLLNNAAYGSGVDVPFKVTALLGLKDNSIEEFIRVYPNPSTGTVNIQSEGLRNFNSVALVDQLGREISSWNIGSTNLSIDMSEVANGSYNLVFKGSNGNHTQKVQINR